MKRFNQALIESVKFPADEFEEYKFKVIVPKEYWAQTKNWLFKGVNKTYDEFISDAIEDVAIAITRNVGYTAGINFVIASKKYSVYSNSKLLAFTCVKDITLQDIKKIIGV
jgi:hypothetical protein